MRIAIVAEEMRVGGLEKYLLLLGRELLTHGADVTIITTEARGEWFDKIAENGLRGDCLPTKRAFSRLSHLLHIAWTLRQYDVIFINHNPEAQLAIEFLTDRSFVVPVLHNNLAQIYRVGFTNAHAWNVAVAVSNKVAAVAKQHEPGKACVVIPNGVEAPLDGEYANRRAFSHPFRLLYVGRLIHSQKAVLFLPDILARCLAENIDCQLEVIGDGPDRDTLLRAFAEKSLTERVTYHPKLSPAKVYDKYLDSHALLLPSFYEGLPLVLLEASACGCVPVVSRLEGITDMVITHGYNGFLTGVGEVQEMVQAIYCLANSAEKWRQFSANARATSLAHFTNQRMAAQYWQLIGALQRGEYPLTQSRRGWGAMLQKAYCSRSALVPNQLRSWYRRIRS